MVASRDVPDPQWTSGRWRRQRSNRRLAHETAPPRSLCLCNRRQPFSQRGIFCYRLFGGRSHCSQFSRELSIAFREVGRLLFERRADAIRCSTASRRVTREGFAARPQGPRTRRLYYSFLQFQVLRSFQIVPKPRSRPLRPVPWQVARTFASRRRGTVRLGR